MDSNYWSRYWNRRLSRRGVLAGGITTALGTAAILAGCGDDDDSGGSTASPGATTGGKVTGVQGAVRGGTFRTSVGDPFRGADPHINTTEPLWIAPLSYSWTHRYHVAENKVILDMATKIEQPDNKTTNIQIRPDIKFHNRPPMNGRVATVEDLIFTYQRLPTLRARGSTINPTAYDWMDLPALQAVDKTTLTIKQTKAYADNIPYMGQQFFAVVGKEAIEAAGGDVNKEFGDAAGTGPYLLSPQSDVNSKMVWNRNPDYFSHDHSDQFWFPEGGGYPDAYELRIHLDPSATQAQLISGDLDQLYYLMLNVDRVIAQDFKSRGLQVVEAQANTNTSMMMAIDKFPDTRVRQAFMKALDYEQITKAVYLGDGELGGLIGNGFPDSVRLPRAEMAKFLKYDPQEANRLWSAAGSAAKSSYVLLSIPNQAFAVQVTNAIKESIEKTLPVKIEIQGADVPTWLARVGAPVPKDWDFCIVYTEATAAVPDGNVLQIYQARDSNAGSSSGFALNSPTAPIAELAKQARQLSDAQSSETDAKARTAKLHAYQRFMLENAIPAIPLPVRKIDWLVANKRLKNIPVKNDNFFRSNLVHNMYLDPNKP
jgi:ABC-type transport system substrate-binding protein